MAGILCTSSQVSLDRKIFNECFSNQFWSLSNEISDLVKHFHLQLKLLGNFGLNGSVPWLEDTAGSVCCICKQDVEDNMYLMLDCTFFRDKFSCYCQNFGIK